MLSTLAQLLESFARECDEEYGPIADDPVSAEALAIILAEIRNCRADLGALYGKVEKDLLALAGEKRFTVYGLGEVEIKKSTNRTEWDNEGLTRKVVALALDERALNEETGEYESAHSAVARVLSECARPSWRLTPLRARHVPIDEYCHEEPGNYSVKLPPRQVTP